jgi:hypothetical protein
MQYHLVTCYYSVSVCYPSRGVQEVDYGEVFSSQFLTMTLVDLVQLAACSHPIRLCEGQVHLRVKVRNTALSSANP